MEWTTAHSSCIGPFVTMGIQVVGHHPPTTESTESEPTPKIYRMYIFAPNEVVAKSRFWYFYNEGVGVSRHQCLHPKLEWSRHLTQR